jgi:hypothetical protein
MSWISSKSCPSVVLLYEYLVNKFEHILHSQQLSEQQMYSLLGVLKPTNLRHLKFSICQLFDDRVYYDVGKIIYH